MKFCKIIELQNGNQVLAEIRPNEDGGFSLVIKTWHKGGQHVVEYGFDQSQAPELAIALDNFDDHSGKCYWDMGEKTMGDQDDDS